MFADFISITWNARYSDSRRFVGSGATSPFCAAYWPYSASIWGVNRTSGPWSPGCSGFSSSTTRAVTTFEMLAIERAFRSPLVVRLSGNPSASTAVAP